MKENNGNEVIIKSVSDNARNGLVTAIGIVLGFTVAFLINFSMHPSKWESDDIPTLIFVISGIIIMIVSLYRSLIPYDQPVKYYERTVRIFVLGGVVFSFIGILFAFVF